MMKRTVVQARALPWPFASSRPPLLALRPSRSPLSAFRTMAGILARKTMLALLAWQSNLKQVAPGITNMASLSTICGRMGLKELISQAPVYTGAREASGGLSLIFRRWATKKSAGSTKNGRDSKPKNLGVKKFGGERVIPGNIIVRQRGTRFHPGDYVGMGKDHTLYALKEGHVRFERHKLSGRKWVHVDPKAGHVLHPIYVNTVAKDDAENQLC